MITISRNLLRTICALGGLSVVATTSWADPTTKTYTTINSSAISSVKTETPNATQSAYATQVERDAAAVKARWSLGITPVFSYPGQAGNNITIIINSPGGNTYPAGYPSYGYPSYGYPTYGYPTYGYPTYPAEYGGYYGYPYGYYRPPVRVRTIPGSIVPRYPNERHNNSYDYYYDYGYGYGYGYSDSYRAYGTGATGARSTTVVSGDTTASSLRHGASTGMGSIGVSGSNTSRSNVSTLPIPGASRLPVVSSVPLSRQDGEIRAR
jgi:hypothetical protein